MYTAKLFMNGKSQAVRLPKECRFTGEDVYVKKLGDVVILIPRDDPWKPLRDSLGHFTDDYMEVREQGLPDRRDPL